MSTKKKKNNRQYGSFWACPNCEGEPSFEHQEMMAHLKDVHGIDTKATKGKRSMTMHLDGDTWFQSNYEWEINGLKFLQTTCTKRSKNDAMMWR